MTAAKTLWSPVCEATTCDACGGVSGNSGGRGVSVGGSCNLTLDATACNGAGNFPLRFRVTLIPGDFRFRSGHLRDCDAGKSVGQAIVCIVKMSRVLRRRHLRIAVVACILLALFLNSYCTSSCLYPRLSCWSRRGTDSR